MKTRRLSKINWRREGYPKFRKPVPMTPGRFIQPDSVYNRHKEKETLRRIVDPYLRDKEDKRNEDNSEQGETMAG